MPSKEIDGTSSVQSFESSLRKLREVLSKMESDDLGLEEMLALYKKGTELVSDCEKRLRVVDAKIKELSAEKIDE